MNKLLFYLNKFTAIVFVAILYVTFGLFLSIIIEKLFNKNKNTEKNHKPWVNYSNTRLVIEIYLECILIVFGAYFIRKLIKNIPYIFDNKYGFNYNQLKEINGTVMTSFIIILLIPNLKKKIIYLIYNRLDLE